MGATAVPAGRVVLSADHIAIRVTGVCKGSPRADAGLFEGDRTTLVVNDGREGLLRPALDQVCLGMRLGETKELEVLLTDAHHPVPTRDESLVVELPTGGADVQLGKTVKVSYHGAPRLAVVTSVDAERQTARCDMNDPVAGRTLVYAVSLEGFDADTAGDRRRQLFPEPPHVPAATWKLEQLREHNGRDAELPILVSVRGFVYDVTDGARHYGPEGMYGFMAGSDATLLLARFALNPALLNQPWRDEDLDEGEQSSLASFVRNFAKYPCVGRLLDGELQKSH